MKIKTTELTGAALNYAVATIEQTDWSKEDLWYNTIGYNDTGDDDEPYQPSINWAQAGPILSEARISRTIDYSGLWIAYWTNGYDDSDEGKKWMQCDHSELVAGLRCFVASKLGDEVDIPMELI